MTESDQIAHFANELDRLIERFRSEYDVSYALVTGTMQMRVHALNHEAMQRYQEVGAAPMPASAPLTLQDRVQRMIESPGIWIATDLRRPGEEVPIISNGGKLYAIEQAQELSAAGFFPEARFRGPFRG